MSSPFASGLLSLRDIGCLNGSRGYQLKILAAGARVLRGDVK